MAINGSASFPPGPIELDSFTWIVDESPTSVPAGLSFTNTNLFIGGSATSVSAGTFIFNDSNATLGLLNADSSGSLTVSLGGHVTTLLMQAVSGGSSSSLEADMPTGYCDVVNMVESGGGNISEYTFSSNQTQPVAFQSDFDATAAYNFSAPNSTSVDITNPPWGNSFGTAVINVGSSLVVPSSMGVNDQSLTINGSFGSATTNAILAAYVAGSASGGSLTIGGTSGAPTGTGITDKATLISNGVTVTTN